MAVNVPLIQIQDLTEQTTAADTDCMVIGGSDAKKIKWSTIVSLILAKITGGASTILTSNLGASKALVSNSSGKVAVSTVTATELGYLSGATGNIQSQINSIQTQVNNHSATGFCALSFTSTTLFSVYGNQYVVKIGKVAFIHLAFAVTSALSAGSQLLTIASGYRPANAINNLAFFDVLNGSVCAVSMATSGAITAVTSMAVGRYVFDYCYPLA